MSDSTRFTRWSDDECAKLRAAIAAGKSQAELRMMFPHRTSAAVDARASMERMTPAQIAARLARRRSGRFQRQVAGTDAEAADRIPIAVIQDQLRRYQISPASLTASICGDPLPGYSALDRTRH